MKLNKTLMLAALVAASMFATDVAVHAQDATNTPAAGARPPGGRARLTFESVATQLDLSEDQKAKVRPIFADMQQKRTEVFKDASLQPADKRAKQKEIMDDTTSKLKDILTPEQFAKWQKLLPTGRRPAGGAGGGTNNPPQN